MLTCNMLNTFRFLTVIQGASMADYHLVQSGSTGLVHEDNEPECLRHIGSSSQGLESHWAHDKCQYWSPQTRILQQHPLVPQIGVCPCLYNPGCHIRSEYESHPRRIVNTDFPNRGIILEQSRHLEAYAC